MTLWFLLEHQTSSSDSFWWAQMPCLWSGFATHDISAQCVPCILTPFHESKLKFLILHRVFYFYSMISSFTTWSFFILLWPMSVKCKLSFIQRSLHIIDFLSQPQWSVVLVSCHISCIHLQKHWCPSCCVWQSCQIHWVLSKPLLSMSSVYKMNSVWNMCLNPDSQSHGLMRFVLWLGLDPLEKNSVSVFHLESDFNHHPAKACCVFAIDKQPQSLCVCACHCSSIDSISHGQWHIFQSQSSFPSTMLWMPRLAGRLSVVVGSFHQKIANHVWKRGRARPSISLASSPPPFSFPDIHARARRHRAAVLLYLVSRVRIANRLFTHVIYVVWALLQTVLRVRVLQRLTVLEHKSRFKGVFDAQAMGNL